MKKPSLTIRPANTGVKRKPVKSNNLSIEGLNHHLDNVEHCTKMYKAYGLKGHADSLAFSRKVIVDTFKELKNSGDK